MLFKIGIENNVEGRSQAWALEHPGCFAYGPNGDAALAAMPEAIANYAAWIASRNQSECWLETDEIELYLAETWEGYAIDEDFNLAEEGYEVNAWFLHDWRPLDEQEILCARQMLSWSRDDLLEAVAGLSPQALQAEHSGERWNIEGILRHVGGAEWWYLDRLGLAQPRQQLPKDTIERLGSVRARLLEVLPALVGFQQVVGVDGEFWSPRKLLRRAIWHERDHTFHIHKLR